MIYKNDSRGTERGKQLCGPFSLYCLSSLVFFKPLPYFMLFMTFQ